MQFRRVKREGLSLDLAPMIDIVFLLLIFFMLTSSFSQPSIKLDLPKAIQSDPKKQENIVISINQQGEIYLNSKLVSKDEFKFSLQEKLNNNPEKSVHIKGDENMSYGTFVEVMDGVRQAGAVQLNIVHKQGD